VNARDILHYGQQHVEQALAGLPDDGWGIVGVTTAWTLRDLVAHLASFELLLEDALKSVLGEAPTPTLDAMVASHATFNDRQVAARAGASPAEVVRELGDAHVRVTQAVERLGAERLRQPGTIPWYGAEYALDDFIVYANYGHKREHCAQIRAFRRRIDQ
jgi:hypothetical protein